MNTVYPESDPIFWSFGQDQTTAQSQAEADQAARASLVEWLTTDPVVVSANLSGIFEDTHILQLQNPGWVSTRCFDELPNCGIGHSYVEPEPASAWVFDPSFDYSDNYVNYNNMNTVS
jgi:hypothetical protein